MLELARVLVPEAAAAGCQNRVVAGPPNGRYAGVIWYRDEQFEDLDARCGAGQHGLSRLYGSAGDRVFHVRVAGIPLGDILRRCTGQAEVVIRR